MRISLLAVLFALLAHWNAARVWSQVPPEVDFHGGAALAAGAVARIGSVAFYHDGGDHIAYSGNGKLLASAGSKIFLWDPATGRELGQFQGDRRATASRGFALSPDGKLLFAASVIYDTRTGKELCKVEKPNGENFHAAFSPDGKFVAAGSDGRLCLWDTATGKEVRQFAQDGGTFWAMAFSPDGKTLFSGESGRQSWGKDLVTRVCDTAAGKELKALRGYELMALSPTGEIVAAAGENRHTLHLIDWRNGKTLVSIKDFPGRGPNGEAEGIERDLTSACFSPDGKVIATTCRFDAAIRLWDAANGNPIRMIPLVANSYCVAFSPDGMTLAVGTPWGHDKLRVRMFDPKTGDEQLLPDQIDEVYEARFLPDGKTLATTSVDKKFRLWQATGGKATHTIVLKKRPRAIAPDGSLVAVSGQPESSSFPADTDREKTVDICDTNTGKVKQQIKHDNNVGPFQKRGHAAVAQFASVAWSCSCGGLMGNSAFSSSSIFGDCHPQSKRRLLPMLWHTWANTSSHRLLNTCARTTNIASAFSFSQQMPLPFRRKLITRRIALSIAPLPIGRWRRR